ncbi:MAG TPA: RNA-binding protein [Bacteroidales bacterium]|nr:MAG: RNA-binding protein [Bacteroidetes bacterium GWF2_33_38]OFY68124.1 MAG: RNA-binding protein [Bacteroidetes bacterium RIFOXYA12_FULL_33_9]OFY91979.1 MAG: RNA-binding protein [Bacteroidetes bacterium RIFOXYA2_FULL_33_7]HBF88139.1 RNA-binding protein [Bacteroidales bacterium]
MNIYIGNLNFNLVEDELKEIFEEYGEVTSVRIITDKFSGRSKGFGFVEMANASEANVAIENLNGADIGGRNIKVSVAQEKQERSERPDRGDRRSFNRRRD